MYLMHERQASDSYRLAASTVVGANIEGVVSFADVESNWNRLEPLPAEMNSEEDVQIVVGEQHRPTAAYAVVMYYCKGDRDSHRAYEAGIATTSATVTFPERVDLRIGGSPWWSTILHVDLHVALFWKHVLNTNMSCLIP